MKPVYLSLGGLFLSASAFASMVSPMISPVYGNDDRLDLFQVTDPQLLRLADSTVALVERESLLLDDSTGTYYELASSLSDTHNVCATEPFAAQKALAFCSGALVGPDLVLTAGHCIKDMDDCNGAKIVFGFSIRQNGGAPDSLPAREVYQCSNIMSRARDIGGADYALIQLDRAVQGHSPLAVERNSNIGVGTALAIIGHPDGLPAKVAGGAFVRDNSDPFKFVANLDSYHGNSGSPVFNVRTGMIEGILVEGEDDYELNEAGECYLNKHCNDDGCMGERSTRISIAVPFIPQLPQDQYVRVEGMRAAPAPVVRTATPVARTPAPARLVRRRRSVFRRIFGN